MFHYDFFFLCLFRLITFGTSNLSRYLNYKHGKRLHTDRVNERIRKLPGKTDKISRMKKYVPYTVGFGLFGVYISTRFSPSFPIPPTKLEVIKNFFFFGKQIGYDNVSVPQRSPLSHKS